MHHRLIGPGKKLTTIVLGVALAGVSCSLGAPERPSAARAAASPVLSDNQGQCPKKAGASSSEQCRMTKFGNVVTDTFIIPHDSPWGLAWSYRCPKPRQFFVVVHLPSLDGIMPTTGVLRHGRSGRGYKMETNNWQQSYDATDPQWRDPQNLVIDSTCAWHVRVIQGDSSVVKQMVPALPAPHSSAAKAARDVG